MAYIGNTAEQQAFTPAIDYFSGNGSTTAFTLSRPVASVAQVQATIENVPQNPGTAFTVSGNTITFDGAPASGTNNIYVYYTSPITQVIQPGQGTVGLTQLTATGTPSASNYLRGDNSWAAVPAATPGGSTTQVQFNNAGAFGGSANLTFNGTTLVATDITDSSLTPGRVVFPTTGGNLTGSADLFWDSANARLGVGTASPTTLEHLSSNTNTQLRIETTNTGSVAVNQYKNAAGETHQIGSETSAGNAGFNGSSAYALCLEAVGSREICFSAGSALRAKITSAGLFQFNSGYGSVATAYGCRAWVKFSGSTGSINGSGNVSSVSDNGTGNFTVNFSTAMPDTNYAWNGTCDPTSAQTSDGAVKVAFGRPDTNPTTSAIALLTASSGAGRDDMESVFVTVHR